METSKSMGWWGFKSTCFGGPSPPSTRISLEPFVFSQSQVTHGDLQNYDQIGVQVNLFLSHQLSLYQVFM